LTPYGGAEGLRVRAFTDPPVRLLWRIRMAAKKKKRKAAPKPTAKRAKRAGHGRSKKTVGAVAANFHEGSRSEILADYLFSSWGTVTPVRRSDDYGLDLFCTLTDRVGQRARVVSYFSVQVKSTDDPWLFDDANAIRWLVEHPTPIFLCHVVKTKGLVRVFHVMPRFYVWAMGSVATRLELTPGSSAHGAPVNWQGGETFSLSAPILEASISDLCDAHRLESLRNVLAAWVDADKTNCDLIRQGLARFRMPDKYETNVVPTPSIVEVGALSVSDTILGRGVQRLTEAAECIGGQLAHQGDRTTALLAALLTSRLKKVVPNAHHARSDRVPGWLGSFINGALNAALAQPGHYYYRGLDAVEQALEEIPLVKDYLSGKPHERPANGDRPGT
jgi:hypothetical protein